MGSLYEDHRTLYQSFAAAYGLTALAAWHLLSRAARADPNRFTVQQLLLMLVAGLCAGTGLPPWPKGGQLTNLHRRRQSAQLVR